MSILDPSSTIDDFPEFDLHRHFPPSSHALPLTSDLDLDLDLDLELDFSVDDLLLPSSSPSDDEADPPQHSDPHPPSPESANSSVINHDSEAKDHGRTSLKRKAEREGDVSPSPNPRISKVRSSSSSADADEGNSSESTFTLGGEEGGGGGGSEEEVKRKARLMRNRESAQLSRQRKKHYVEELEDKVRAMSSTIADLNGKISFYMSENARLHHQLTGTSAVAANPNLPPAAGTAAPAFPPPPLPMHFPWIPYAGYPHHPLRPNGAPVPLVPIPRLKPQQQAPAAKSKKSESRRSGGGGDGKGRTKKVASVSLLGVIFFMFLVFGGVINLGRDAALSGKGRVLSVSGVRRINKGLNNSTDAKQNSSESIPALLYVPRNGRHVEINGNLIIHSVLASERAMAEAKSGKQKSEGKEGGTGLAIPPRSVVSAALAVPESERDLGRHTKAYLNTAERVRALGSKPQDALKSTPADGPLQQWFREGLAGPILSSGTCTEVFQFEVSPSSASPTGGIVSATSVVNATDKLPPVKMKNRRILYPHAIPLTGSGINDTQNFGKPSEKKGNFHSNSTIPSMVVSVMADPREAGDGDGDGMITPKSLSRIFVVVLMDSVKYVTYSCVLPLKSYGPHLVH